MKSKEMENGMIITQIEQLDQKKRKVYIDGEFSFLLYSNEIRSYRLEEGEPIESSTYEELEKVVIKRAKLKVMDLLKRSDKTESELRMKLKQGYFPSEAIELAIEYVKSYGYLNDERYALNYIRMKKNSKSKNAIIYELSIKGISKEVINLYMEEEFSYEDEEEAIKKLIYKKTKNPEELPIEKKQKIIASICRKGFSYEKVKKFF